MKNIEKFLIDTKTYHEFCRFCMKQTFNNLNRELIHSDRWSIVYDWVHDNNYENDDLYEGIETDLTLYWEKDLLHMK